MSVHEIEAAIIRLTPPQLLGLLTWLQEYHAEASQQALAPNAAPLDTELDETEEVYATAD